MKRIERLFFRCLVSLAAASAIAFGVQASAQQAGSDPIEMAHGPVVVCFAEGTDPEYQFQVQQIVDQLNGQQFFNGNRWAGAQGSPITLRWSFVPDGLFISGGVGEPGSPSNLFAQLDADFAGQGGRTTWVSRFQACFDRWQQISGVTFTRVTSGGNDWDDGAAWGAAGAATRGDIRISMHPIDGGGPGTLGYTQFPSGGDMVIDSDDAWGNSTNLNRLLRNMVMHELGHALGIGHVCSSNSGQLMEPFLATGFDGPQHDDIRAVERHYGDPYEADDSAANANNLGTIATNTTLNNFCNVPAGLSGTPPANSSICSVDADAENDWWRFAVSGGVEVSIQLTPQGFSYQQSPDYDQVGNCLNSTTMNSLAVANLDMQLIAANGTTVLATANSAAAGANETIPNIDVGTASFLYVRVYESGTTTGPQNYKLSISVLDTCSGPPDCNGNGVKDDCDIANGTSTDHNGNGLLDECENFVGAPYCFGDQTNIFFLPCPCDNAGGVGRGCANSVVPTGALLAVSGQTDVFDTISLNVSGMPNTASAIFLKGDATIALGTTFGDGVRCVDGSLIRLGTATAVGGAASYPTGVQPLVSVRGLTPVGSGLTGYYQTYYRNASATFCPPETFNVSNGFQITW
jgi:hypothetical protein